ncbi:hypothetical protein [Halomicronema hongdechloris]|nr:hypothetical protein [Halomicronema hongdechloris]
MIVIPAAAGIQGVNFGRMQIALPGIMGLFFPIIWLPQEAMPTTCLRRTVGIGYYMGGNTYR